MLINTYFDSQFSYCPVLWMFHSRDMSIRINNLHYRALRLIYQDNTSSFDELLLKDGSVIIQHKNLQNLAIEMFKVIIGEATTFMKEIFSINDNLNGENVSANTPSQSLFYTPNIPKKVNTGLQTVRYMGPNIWDMVPNEIKNVAFLSISKNKIRNYTFLKCTCRLCLDNQTWDLYR